MVGAAGPAGRGTTMGVTRRWMAVGLLVAGLALAAAACGGSYATQPGSGSAPSESPAGTPGRY